MGVEKNQKEELTDKKNPSGWKSKSAIREPTQVSEGSEHVCRICWGTEQEDLQKSSNDDFNPLISPCKCAGTMGMIHLKCLRGWLETKRQMKVHGKQVILKFKKLDCELCNTKFPFKISYNNEIVDIVGVEKPERNYIILESLSNESQKIFHVIDTGDLQPYTQGLGYQH
jgi:hypothetical protein